MLISLLEQHPEGIVLYDRTQPHAVLLTDYTNGIFYCSDPAGNIGYGRIPITSSSVSIARASCSGTSLQITTAWRHRPMVCGWRACATR